MYSKIEFGFIHNWVDGLGFDVDAFSIDRVYYNKFTGRVEYAERIFSVRSPEWLQKIVFGKIVIPRSKHGNN